MIQFIGTRPTMITTTSYGTWLPGDCRGYVRRGEVLPPDPVLEALSAARLKHRPVVFNEAQQQTLFHALCDAAEEFGYRLSDASVESWHLHWIVFHDDPAAKMVGRLKNRMRQALNQGRIWTDGYHFSELVTEEALQAAEEYIAKHDGARMLAGRVVQAGKRSS